MGVKDVILTKDMPTQHFSPIYKDDHPVIDAGPVMTLRAAGALIFGKVRSSLYDSRRPAEKSCRHIQPNLQRQSHLRSPPSQMLKCRLCRCQKGPPTCNPKDPTRTAGGSSSGSGAVVADFQVPIALGSRFGQYSLNCDTKGQPASSNRRQYDSAGRI